MPPVPLDLRHFPPFAGGHQVTEIRYGHAFLSPLRAPRAGSPEALDTSSFAWSRKSWQKRPSSSHPERTPGQHGGPTQPRPSLRVRKCQPACEAVATMCPALELSTSGYYAWRKRNVSQRSRKMEAVEQEGRRGMWPSHGRLLRFMRRVLLARRGRPRPPFRRSSLPGSAFFALVRPPVQQLQLVTKTDCRELLPIRI